MKPRTFEFVKPGKQYYFATETHRGWYIFMDDHSAYMLIIGGKDCQTLPEYLRETTTEGA